MQSFMKQRGATSGMFWARQGVRLARGIAIATAVASCSAVCSAQGVGSAVSSADPRLAAFGALPPAIQAALIRQGQDLVRDATTPGAVRSYSQVCAQFGPIGVCESMDGASVSAGIIEGGSVTVNRDGNGRWSVGVGPEATIPGFVGATANATQYLGTGNIEACAGPTFGLAPVFSVSPQECVTVDRERAREMREAIAYGQRTAAQRGSQPATSSGDAAPLEQARQDAYQAYQQMLNQVRNDPNVYNNPFANGGGSTSSGAAPTYQQVLMPHVPNRPAGSTGSGAGMSADQFRASVNQSMQQFRQADAKPRQNQASETSNPTSTTARPDRQLVFDENAVRNPNVSQNPQIYAPRNGNDAQGYRQDSPRNQYNAQGYRTDPSRSQYDAQGYRTDGSRNQYDAQGGRTAAPRSQYDSQGYRTDSTSRPNVTRYTYDANATSSAVSGPRSQPAQAPVIPNVSQRVAGTRSQTAALRLSGE